EQILVKITLEEAHSDTKIQFRPFLAFRNIHKLSKANLHLNRQYTSIENGIKSRMYEGYPDLHMQLSKKSEFVPVPDWYFNIEYLEEQRRGYEYKEDLYVPGYFEVAIKKGESIVFSASTAKEKPAGLKRIFDEEAESRVPLDSYTNCLHNSAEQFLVHKDKETSVLAGFPWHGTKGRDTFIALPGLTMTSGKIQTALEVIDSMIGKLENGLFPNTSKQGHDFYNSIDAPLWFIWTLQQLEKTGEFEIWKKYKKPILEILNAFQNGTSFGIKVHENGLVSGNDDTIPLTWMDAMVHGHPVTLRRGYAVEVNALWYNAVCQIRVWSGEKSKLGNEMNALSELIKKSFTEKFWIPGKEYLADYVDGGFADYSVRPNQVIATSLDFSPLSQEMKKSVLDVVKSELLTPKGLRTLSPKNEAYVGIYDGDQVKRDSSAHQGSVYPWLMEHYVYGYLGVHKKSGINVAKKIYSGFEVDMTEYGIGTISELCDGNPPFDPKGATSFAGSVASLLRIGAIIENY
ncbi:MAG: glycogen debranching enzyme N-terminal domain-containing protein, partial [Bacteroidales bacterium]|nr:glycogen debranching enzyme N-terminal domain-containing protein [Bacteroidales bacterium]